MEVGGWKCEGGQLGQLGQALREGGGEDEIG